MFENLRKSKKKIKNVRNSGNKKKRLVFKLKKKIIIIIIIINKKSKSVLTDITYYIYSKKKYFSKNYSKKIKRKTENKIVKLNKFNSENELF